MKYGALTDVPEPPERLAICASLLTSAVPAMYALLCLDMLVLVLLLTVSPLATALQFNKLLFERV